MKAKREKAPTREEVRQMVEEGFAVWSGGRGTPEAIKQRVHAKLDKGVEQIVASLLGFSRDSWDVWRIDHCNGRAGESAAGDYMRENAKVAVETWLEAHFGELPALPKAAIKELRQEYERTFHEVLRRRLRELASRNAEDVAQEMIDAVMASSETSEPGGGST